MRFPSGVDAEGAIRKTLKYLVQFKNSSISVHAHLNSTLLYRCQIVIQPYISSSCEHDAQPYLGTLRRDEATA